jgi:hypothetical protein
MQDQELDRLRDLITRKMERRRPGVWRFVRKLAWFMPMLRAAFGAPTGGI